MKRKELIDQINSRKDELAEISKILKNKFVGIDGMIDSIMSNIIVWYCMPELLTRPVIVNLWGMTGVGKTDLIRNLAKLLKMTDRFVEVQMSNKSQSIMNSIKMVLECSSIEPNECGILLLDEIQRFRTIADNGEEISDYDFQDVWMLLSDGCFASEIDTKSEIMKELFSTLYYKESREMEAEEDDEDEDGIPTGNSSSRDATNKKRKYKQSYYSAMYFKKKLRIKNSVEEIMGWDEKKQLDILYSAVKEQSTFEGDSYSKLLIFISGNLDEAYSMSKATSNSDIDADILHEFSKKITPVTIKSVLRNRFKPEQIARFGNTHIVYPSLSKQNYKDIIAKQIDQIVVNTAKNGVSIKTDKSVNEWVYRNGVFPAQGVRPVISTVASMLGNSIPEFVLFALEQNKKSIRISCEKDYIKAKMGDQEIKRRIVGCIDNIKMDKDKNARVIFSTHEAGHAVAYAALFGFSPTQIVSNTSDEELEGYVGCHMMNSSKDYMKKQICIMLAGQVAEELVFGDEAKTSGSSSDLLVATRFASGYFRSLGMDGYVGVHQNPYSSGQDAIYDLNATDDGIEQMLKDEKLHSAQILTDHRDLFVDLVETLIKKDEVTPYEFVQIAAKHGLAISAKPVREEIISDYCSKFEKFKN
jgi:cell division protease FtsH